MADGMKILAKAEKIKTAIQEIKVSMKSSVPACSKTKTFLKDHNIDIIEFL